MKLKSLMTFALVLSLCSGSAFAANAKHKNKDKQLPQGLQMKLDRGGSLPPGWQRKLVRGEILAEPIYSHSEIVIPVDSEWLLTVRVEGKLIRLIQATREIIDIVDGFSTEFSDHGATRNCRLRQQVAGICDVHAACRAVVMACLLIGQIVDDCVTKLEELIRCYRM